MTVLVITGVIAFLAGLLVGVLVVSSLPFSPFR